MDAKQFFCARYEGFQEYPEHLLNDLSDAQQRRSPQPQLNPIAWTTWHIARCEDVGVNGLIADGPQVWAADRWPQRLRVPGPGMGTGMTRAEVSALCATVDLTELRAYRAAVVARTRREVAALVPSELDVELDRGRLHRVLVGDGAGGSVAGAIVDAYAGQTKGWLLGHLVLTHSYYHIGQAFGVRALHGAPNPW